MPICKRPAAVALAMGALGLALRIWLTALDAPLTNSDEATIGLASLHIWRGQDLPVYFYGQHYMGTIEAYLAAPLVGLLGPTTLALRIPTLTLFALFLFLMYALTRRVFGPSIAVVSIAFLALGSDRIIKDQLIAGGGYPETAPMLAALLLGVLVLIREPVRRRPWVMGGVGLLAGLILWNHLLPLPYLAAAGSLLVVGYRAQLRSRAGAALLGGLVIGFSPAIWHDLHHSFGDSAIGTFWHLQTTGTDPSFGDRLYGGAILGIPLGTGMCAPSDCTPWQLWWGPVYVALLVIAAGLAWQAPKSPERGMRLVLTIASLLTVVSYARTSAAGDSPIESARYLSCLLVATPVWIEPIWLFLRSTARPAWQRLGATVPLAAAGAMAIFATAALIAHTPVYTANTRDQRTVLQALEHNNIFRMFADYWTCDWIAYQTGEDRICAVVADDLTKGFNRYAPYWDEVRASSTVAYLAPIGSPLDARLADVQGHHAVVQAANYHIYLPVLNRPE